MADMSINELFRRLTAKYNENHAELMSIISEDSAEIHQMCRSWKPGKGDASAFTVVLEEEKKDPRVIFGNFEMFHAW